MTRLSRTTALCLAIMRSAESFIRELAITMPSTLASSLSMLVRSISADSPVWDRMSMYPAARAASKAPLMISP